MLVLLAFSFLAGVVTILSPCILPILPIILSSSSVDSSKKRPIGVVVGFVLSFTFFTLFLSTIVKISGFPAESLRFISIFILSIFGASLLIPKVQILIEQLFSRLSSLVPNGKDKKGFSGGILIGFSLGLLWTPCVGPILASVISLAISGTVSSQAFLITLAYSLGTAIPMFMIMQAGSTALQKVPWLVRNTAKIQKSFGVLMIVTAIGIYFNLDRQFQTFVLETFPQYGAGLTKFEDNEKVKQELDRVNDPYANESSNKKSSLFEKKVYAPEIIAGGEWFNSEPLKISELKGKVVLIDFWTYSCINCQRTFPYLKNWWEKYKDQGLVIIGVHSPEFEFEKNPENVSKALDDFELTYPVVQDNSFDTWKAYKNRYWPAKYLIDQKGEVRYTHFGEGDYDETEEMIQKLLKEIGAEVSDDDVNNPEYSNYARTPEIYLGYDRIKNFLSPEKVIEDEESEYSFPQSLSKNTFAFQGNWKLMPEYSTAKKGSKLELNFESKEVFIVARAKNSNAKFSALLDGKVESMGIDAPNGFVTIDSDRLYHLISLPSAGSHTLLIEFLDDDIEVYAFTFG